MSDSTVSRLILLDSGLRAERGHHANFTRLLRHEALARGWSCAVYSNREISDHLRVEFDPVRHFQCSPYDRTCSVPTRADIEHYITQNEMFYRELCHLQLDADEHNLILVPTITHNQLLGFAQWLGSAASPQRARFAVMLLFSPGWEVLGTPEPIARALYHHALRKLANLTHRRCELFAETQLVAEQFTPLAERPVHVVPWPTAESHLDSLVVRPCDRDAPCIGYLGYAKQERGISLLPSCIEQVLGERPDVSFFVQVDTFLPATVRDELAALQAIGQRVQVHLGSMPRERFLEQLAALDAVLLPYEPYAYRRRGSALFSEAAMLGKPMVVPANTWMAEQMLTHNLGGECFDRFESASIGTATLRLLDHLDDHLARSRNAAPAWRTQRTAAAFLDRVLDTLRYSANLAGTFEKAAVSGES